MATYRVRPSKQQAVFTAVGAVVTGTVGTVMMISQGKVTWFLAVWLLFVVGIAGMSLWSAFARNGHLQTIEVEEGDKPPARFGQVMERRD
ncbi:hypothetical protein FDO65_00330 [Nakamurella flava]|uniref:Uncharacterized protein n=1 Tax=Nakamurella flava TaxID=2576308 RepID=A0A4U6QIM1_9ACTN|nr:hypothetical protein [Nakamurella flava]TKV60220.1 hypothetical protein FDO65_00330 [Nakamurella flava]